MSQAIMLITTLTLLSKGFGFVRDMIVAYFFGTSNTMDAFLASQNPLNLLSGIVMGTVVAAFIPLFIRVRKEKGQDEAEHFSATIFYSSFSLLLILIALSAFFAPDVAKVFVPGFSGEKLALTAKFLRWMSFAALITSSLNFINAILRSEKKFLAYPLTGLGFDVVVIATLFITKNLGDLSLALAWTSGPLFMMLILAFAERHYLNPFKLKKGIPETKILFKMVLPLLFSSAFGMLNTIIDRSFASALTTGAISALGYAARIKGAVSGVLGTPVSQVTYPSIATHVTEKDTNGLSITVIRSMKLLSFFLIPISFALFPLAKGIVGILFQRGNFTYASTLLTYPPLIASSISLFTMAYNGVLVQVYYSFKDSKTPMIYGTIGIGINILLNFLFISPLKQTGLALSTSLASFYFTIIMLHSLKRRFGIRFFNLWYFFRVIISSTIMMVGMYLIMLSMNGRIRYVIAALTGIGVYYIMSRIVKTLPKHFLRYLKFKKVAPEIKEKIQ